MTTKAILACLAVHFFTIIGGLMMGLDVGNCERSSDFLCGTPLSGFFGQSQGLQATANPFRFAGAVLKLMGVLLKLTWYNYEWLAASGYALVQMVYFMIKAAFAAVWIRVLWQSKGLLSQAVGRFFTR